MERTGFPLCSVRTGTSPRQGGFRRRFMCGAASRAVGCPGAVGLPWRQQALFCSRGWAAGPGSWVCPEPCSSCPERACPHPESDGWACRQTPALEAEAADTPYSEPRVPPPPPRASPLQQPYSDFLIPHAPTQPVKPPQNPECGPAGRAVALPTHPGHRRDRKHPRRGSSVTRRSNARPAELPLLPLV